MPQPTDARYVWYDQQGRGRNLYACFRRAFDLQDPTKSAKLHLFADSAYQLFVNGQFVDFGPTRFDPRLPMYDTVDIRRYLRPGRNVIAVSVNSFQHKTYKAIANPAGFIAWGEVRPATGQPLSLSTPGKWTCTRDGAYARYVGKYSFALNAADLFDQAGEQPGWIGSTFDDSHWPPAAVLDDQSTWGDLTPRSIPMMSGKPVPFAALRHVVPLANVEQWYSFSVPFPAQYEDDRHQFSKFVRFTTWVYSPVDQEITAGVFWGESFLNGAQLSRGVDANIHNHRISQRWPLRKGWNHLFGSVGAYQDIVEQYFALPSDKGLIISADRDERSPCRFLHTPILSAADFERHLATKPMPYSPDDELPEIGGWVRATEPAQSPCREMGWDTFAEPLEALTLETLQGHTFRLADYPHGVSILLDAGYTRLVLPMLKLSGVAGATLDLSYHEHLRPDGMHLLSQHHYPCCDRVLCSRDSIDWLPSHPRGFRYLMLTIRNPKSDVTLQSLTLRSAMYPVKAKGHFACSDPLLTEIWQMGQRTQATNMEDAYVDCVGRERGMYGRDTIIQYHANLAAFGDQALMGRCMQLYGQSPDASGKFRAVYPNTGTYTIADFALNMVEGYENYYHNSGDLARVREDWPAILRNLQWFHDLADERKDMLLDADWPTKRGVSAMYGGFHGDLSAHWCQSLKGVHCVFSSTYLMALRAGARLATTLGRQADASELNRRAAVVSKSIAKTFWNAKLRCYADNITHETFSPHASLLAVCSGAATRPQIPHIRRYVAEKMACLFRNGYDPSAGVIMSPNYAFYLFDGLYRLGLAAVAENLMREGWGWARAQGLQTCPEYFSLDVSHCHAWSASPTYYLSRNVLGIHFPKAPDLNQVEIRIQTDGVTWAEGAWPHPAGLIEVKWHTKDGKRIFDHLRAPKGVKAKISR